MYASIHDSVRALAKKLGADPNGAAVEDTLNNIAKKLGGDPVKAKGISKAIDAITAVADIDDMHNVGKLNVTPTTSAQTLTPESPLDGWDEVKVSAVTSDIDENIVAGNIKKDVSILGVTGNYDPTPTLVPKNITANGTYAASSDNADGYSSVTVDVASENNAKFGNTPTTFVLANIVSIDIPSGVTSIGNNAFQNCTNLTAIDIPSSVTSIGNNAFTGCTNLTAITIHKAEGSITGAPWGATNATVVWDG